MADFDTFVTNPSCYSAIALAQYVFLDRIMHPPNMSVVEHYLDYAWNSPSEESPFEGKDLGKESLMMDGTNFTNQGVTIRL